MTELDYRRRAELHRPDDPAAIEAEVSRLTAQGLKIRDGAAALKLSTHEVEQILVRHALAAHSSQHASGK